MTPSRPFRLSNLGRMSTIALFVGLLFVVSDVQAQNHRGWWRRSARTYNGPHLFSKRQVSRDAVQAQQLVPPQHPAQETVNGQSTATSNRVNHRRFDPRLWHDPDAYSRYPKFIGGFHSSHFSDIGLPNGDRGFRGNGIYWTPW